MKKLLILLAGIFMMSAMASGQATMILKADQNYGAFDIAKMSPAFKTQSDSLAYNQFAMGMVGREKLQFYTVTVKLSGSSTETSDTTSALVRSILYAGYGNYLKTNLDTVDWAMSSADTIFRFQDLSTGTDANYLYLKNTVMEDSTNFSVVAVEIKTTNK